MAKCIITAPKDTPAFYAWRGIQSKSMTPEQEDEGWASHLAYVLNHTIFADSVSASRRKMRAEVDNA